MPTTRCRNAHRRAGGVGSATPPSGCQKDYATFLKTSEETGGEGTLIEIEPAPGGGNQPHYHLTYDEHFEVLEGALEVQLGKASRTLRPSEKATAYKTVLHRFRNPAEEPGPLAGRIAAGPQRV
jgi:mannose-6-phosphate isomerase-like protein (cupin superfamily)